MMSDGKCNCCVCGADMPDSSPLSSPFDYADDEFPKRYAHVCPRCLEEFSEGKRTKQEFLDAAGRGFEL